METCLRHFKCQFSHDVNKIQSTKLLILLRIFYLFIIIIIIIIIITIIITYSTLCDVTCDTVIYISYSNLR